MSDLTPVAPQPADPSMRGPWTASFLLHAGVVGLVTLFAWQNAESVQRQVEANAERVEQEEQREELRAREEERAAAALAARERLKMEVADLVTLDGASPEASQVLAAVGGSLDELFKDGGEMDAGEWEQARMEAVEQAQADADRLLREEIVAEARAHVRDRVAPELRERIERELRDKAGSEMEKAIGGAVRDDQAKRLRDSAAELRRQAEELGKAKRDLEQGATHAERGEQREAADKAGQARDTVAKGEDALKRAVESAAANDPKAADKATAAADGSAAREAVERATDGGKDTAKKAAAEVGKRQQAVERLAAELESHAGKKDGMDANERALADKGREAIDPELRERVAKRVAEKAVPEAAAKVADAIGAELQRAGIDRAPFEQLLREDITKALGEEMASASAEAALERTDRAAGRATGAELAKAQAAASSAAEKLAELARQQDALKERQGNRAEPESALAKEAASAEREARDAVSEGRRVSLKSDAALDGALEPLKQRGASEAARRAENAERSGDRPKADEAMTQTSEALRAAAAGLAKAAEALGKEREDLAKAAAAHGNGPAPMGPPAEAVAGVAAAARGAIAAAEAGVDAAGAATGTGGTALDAAKLARLMALKEALAQAKKNADEGRALGNPALFGAPGAGKGAGAGMGKATAKRMRMASFNREAYEAFVKDLRERTNPTSAYAEVKQVDGLDSVAEPERGPFPAAVWAPEPKPVPAADAAKPVAASTADRTVPQPTFKHVAFGAAAMVTAPITIDGDLSDWGELTHALEVRWRAGDATTPAPAGPRLHVRWSNEGLYIAYAVADAGGIQPNREHAYSGDCLELWLDLENARRDQMRKSQFTHQFCFDPFGFNGDAKTTFVEVGRDHRGLKMFQQYADPTGTRGRSAAKEVPGGYTVEAFVARAALSKPVLVPGAYIALNASINIDYEERNQMQWSASKAIQTWDKPDTWGDVLLLGSDASVAALDSDGAKTTRLVPGQALQVEVVDPDMDLDEAREDRVMASVVGEGGEPMLLVLRETTPGSGIFRGSINTQIWLDEPRRNTLAVRPGDTVTIAYDDPRAAYGEQDRRVTAELPVATSVIRLATVTP